MPMLDRVDITFRESDLISQAKLIANDAIELSMAPNCPSEKIDALIAPTK